MKRTLKNNATPSKAIRTATDPTAKVKQLKRSKKDPLTTPKLKESGPSTLDALFAQEHQQDLLRFITCGSVDDGKSTLIGRLLWESQHIFEDQIRSLQSDTKKFGTQGENIDFALLVDGLAAEREQGITIDVAYRFFASKKRKFIVADTPGHEQYTRNMITGASTADVAIILIDASKGVLTQTKRHAYLVSLMGIKHIALAINKMDLVEFDQDSYNATCADFMQFTRDFGFASVTPIPVSALLGDNMTERSSNMPWYTGPTLMTYLEEVAITQASKASPALPVQWVNRPSSDFRGFSGTLAQGSLNVGDVVRVTASGQTAKITEIITPNRVLSKIGSKVRAGEAITLCLDAEIDASRGDVFSLAKQPLAMTDQFEATLVWMAVDPGFTGRSYDIVLSSQNATASITSIKYQIDINTLAHQAAKELSLNAIAVCNLSISKPLVFDTYRQSKHFGSFILIDRFTNATVAAGLITHSLRRADNIHPQVLTITQKEREKLNGHPGKVIWFTGLSGSGKSTLANALEVELHRQGKRTYILDGDNIRQGLNKDLGFTDSDRVENIRRITEVAKLMMDAGLIVITAFISPFKREREMAKERIGEGHFVEVFVDTPIEVCEKRDPKGLYQKARDGKLPNFSGISSPYEAPDLPDVRVDTSKQKSNAKAIGAILAFLKEY
jgi:bifunctional enzyme CysN/CysC